MRFDGGGVAEDEPVLGIERGFAPEAPEMAGGGGRHAVKGDGGMALRTDEPGEQWGEIFKVDEFMPASAEQALVLGGGEAAGIAPGGTAPDEMTGGGEDGGLLICEEFLGGA